jgi:hypothetical protein
MAAPRIVTAAGLVVALAIAPVAAQEPRPASVAGGTGNVRPTFATSRLNQDWTLFNHTPAFESLPGRYGRNLFPVPASESSAGRLMIVAPADLTFQEEADPPSTTAQPPERENWIKKHPAKFGAIVGAAVGAAPAVYETGTCPPTRSCSTAGAGILFGAMTGAGIGALTGWVISKATR